MRLGAGEGTVGGGLTLDELIVRELVAKVVLPVVEAGWPTGGQGVANQVSFELLFPRPPPHS